MPQVRVLTHVTTPPQVQNQHFLNQNQNHMAQQQVQTKDMPPRFSKKGQINADEVTWRLVPGSRGAQVIIGCILRFMPDD